MFPCHELSAFQKSLQRQVLIILARVRARFPAAILVAKGKQGIRAPCLQFFFIFPQLKVEPKHQQLLGKIADLESEKVAAESKIRQLQLQMSNKADEVSMGGGGGGGDVREHARLPRSFLPENLESTNLETLFLECFMRCFFRKVNLIHL